MHFLHAFDVKIERIGQRVGDFSSTEGFREFANRIFDGETWSIADFTKDFIRGNMVGAVVVSGRMRDLNLAANDLTDLIGNGV